MQLPATSSLFPSSLLSTWVPDLMPNRLADCRHELRPVLEGYRLALIYNLVLKAKGPPPALKDCSGLKARLTAALQGWTADAELPDRQIWMLDHQYAPLTDLADPTLPCIRLAASLSAGSDGYFCCTCNAAFVSSVLLGAQKAQTCWFRGLQSHTLQKLQGSEVFAVAYTPSQQHSKFLP